MPHGAHMVMSKYVTCGEKNKRTPGVHTMTFSILPDVRGRYDIAPASRLDVDTQQPKRSEMFVGDVLKIDKSV